jgi:hypothetical protein
MNEATTTLTRADVVNAKFDPVVPAEVEFVAVALQVRFADAVERADKAALQQSEAAFDGVRRHVSAGVFLLSVIDRFVSDETAAELRVDLGVMVIKRASRETCCMRIGLSVAAVTSGT